MNQDKLSENSAELQIGTEPIHAVPKGPLTSFVGRRAELSEVKELLSGVRLLTLTGVGGCGKTRLALQVANELAIQYEHDIVWVELAPLTESTLVVRTVAQTLGILEVTDQALIDTLSTALKTKPALLILDNCEHVRAACGQLAETLLQAAPGLQILATSREPLAIPGETTWLVPSLLVPEPAEREQSSVSDLLRYDAIALFEVRCKAAQPKFALNEHNAAAVVQICDQLDGIPLAIELAASKIRVLTVEQIAARLVDRFSLLTSNNRSSTIPRHQTLRAAIDWSYDLLSVNERVMLQRLSVFRGGFSLEAVEHVCTGDPIQPDDALNLLSDLIDKSMVLVDMEGRSEARYHLLEIIRQYADQKLADEGQSVALKNRQLDFICQMVSEAEVAFIETKQAKWLEKLEAEHDNIRAALLWSHESGAGEPGLKLVGSLGRFWDTRGYLVEGREWLTKILQQGQMEPTKTWAKALNVAGTLALLQGDIQAARIRLEQGLAIWKQIGDVRGIAVSLNNLSIVTINLADYAAARSLLEESVELKRSLGDKIGLANAYNNLGEVARYEGDYARAVSLYTESLTVVQELGDLEHVSTALLNLGCAHVALNNYDEAVSNLAESMRLACQVGYKRNIALCTARLAILAGAVQDAELAIQLSASTEAQYEVIGFSMEPIDRTEYEQNLTLQRAKLSDAELESAWKAGRAMTEETVFQAIQKIGAEIDSRSSKPLDSVVSMSSPTLRIHSLGSTRIFRDEQLLKQSDWTYAKSREMFFYLLAHKTASKRAIGLDLWPDASPQQLRNNFRVALHCLRRAVGTQDSILFEDALYKVSPSLNYWFDADEFKTLVKRAATADKAEAIELLAAAVRLYSGDFLADMDAGDWHMAQREELRRLYIDHGFKLARLLMAETRYPEATDIYTSLIAYDSYLETAHYELMRCYALQGERNQALRHYRTLVQLMQNDLGLPPSAETTQLYEQLRQGEPIELKS